MNSLNHIYRTIWSEALGAWIAVSEITKSKGKRTASSLIRALRIAGRTSPEGDSAIKGRLKPIVFALACCFAINAQANPTGGQVVSGGASFSNSGNTLTVINTPGTIINWQGFSIDANEITQFVQQNASSTVLNRVVTNNPSVILGTLQSNGQVYLVNANGIMFGAGSTVDVAGLVATTLNLSNADFLAGRQRFTDVSGAKNISNRGDINAQQGGQIYLIAPNVTNNGIITAPNGEILLAAGHSVELVNSNDPNLRVKISSQPGNVTNLGQLIVESGSLGLFGAVVKNSGTASADSATMEGGRIVFKSSQRTEVSGTVSASGAGGGEIHVLSDMQDGTVQVSGTLDASAPVSGDGGYIDTSAAHVQIKEGARISTLAANGVNGNWLIDPTDFYVSAIDPANGSSWMSNTTLSTNLGMGNITIQTLASGAGNGDIFINDAVGWTSGTTLLLSAHRNVEINAAITSGGLNLPSGVLSVRADSDSTGTGTILFGAGGSVSLQWSNGMANFLGTALFYYNPVSYTDAATRSDVGGNPYTGFVNANLTAWMLVNNVNNLQAINTNLAGNYALGHSIDAALTSTWNAGAGFIPLGNAVTNFTGNFNGNGYAISALTINRPTTDYVGLFGLLGRDAQVGNVGLIGSSITGQNFVGGLAGENTGAISDSYVYDSLVAGVTDVGGMVGRNWGGFFFSTSLSTNVHFNGSIFNSYVSGGSVAGSTNVGGLVGLNAATSVAAAAINNTYVVGTSVAGTTNVGGLVGENGQANTPSPTFNNILGTISNSYSSSGVVTGTTNVGGIVGLNDFGGTVTTSFWDSVTTGQAIYGSGSGTVTGAVDFATFSMNQASLTAAGMDFTNTWWMIDGNTRPFLRTEYSTTITNSHQLQLMMMDQTANYTMANNIVMTPSMLAGGMWSNAGFVSIGDPMIFPYGFTGKFDGLGNTITGLYINRPTANYVGLFGALSTGGGVSNVSLVNANVTGLNYVGGLVGYSSSGSVSNSQVIGGSVSGTSFVGALVGSSYNSVFDNDHASSNVSGTANIGGLVGGATIGTISNSYVDGGSVLGTSSVGGLVGSVIGTGVVSNSHYNINAVTINGANNVVTLGGLFNNNTANANGVGQFTDWLNGGLSLNIANYTIANGGSLGTSGLNSYTIGTAQGMRDMLGFADNAAYTFTQTGNITLSAGVYIPYLAADFNGAGFIISGLNLNQFYSSNLGLFGNIAPGATVSNVALLNAFVVGNSDVGALAGLNEGVILNSHSVNGVVAGIGSTNGSDVGVGGLVGHNLQGTIDGSYVSGGMVSGVDNIGGLVGVNAGTTSSATVFSGFITNSYVDGGTIVAGTGNNIGGLVGLNAAGSIDSSYVSAGVVSGNLNVGGLVGLNGNTMNTRVSAISNSSVDMGTTVDGFNYIGGLVGHDSGEGAIQGNTVTATSVTGNSYVGGLVGSVQQASFSNTGYLIDNQVVSSFVTGGAVTGSVSGIVGGYIGGLVGWSGNTITNGSVVGTVVTGTSEVGGLVGHNQNLTISGFTGGIISNSYVSGGTVSGGISVGGLAGNNSGNLSNSFVIGTNVTGTGTNANNIGGLAGLNNGAIVNTYASGGTVSGVNNVGGLVGNNDFSGTIGFSYANVGSVSGTANVGGVVGNNYTPGSVTNTFWNSALTNANLTFGIGYDFTTLGGINTGAIGRTTAQLMTMSTFAGWNIANTGGAGMIWRIYEGQTGPMLTSFLTQATVSANNAIITYNGNGYSGGNGVTASVIAANGGSLLGMPVYGGTSQGAVNAGSYTLGASGMYSDQLGYDIVGYTNGTLTVNQATLTLNAVTDIRVYDGTTFSGGAVNIVGLVGGDTISGVTQSFGSRNVLGANGSTLTANNSGYIISDGNGGNNYIVVIGSSATGTITPATLTVTADDASKYIGAFDPALTYTLGGLQTGDTAGSTLSGTLIRDPGEAMGSYAINQGSLGLTTNNYTITFVSGTFSIVDVLPITEPVLSRLVDSIQGGGAFGPGGKKRNTMLAAANTSQGDSLPADLPKMVCK